MTTKQRAQLYHELGKLIGAGVHVDRSVELLLAQRPVASMRMWLEGLRRGLAARLSIAESVKQHTESVPMEVSLLAAGERGGRIEAAFEHLARYYELRQKSRDKAVGALVYPIILLHFGLVLPELPQVIMGDGSIGRILLQLAIAWALLLGLGFGAVAAVKLAATSPAADAFLNRIPLIGGVRRHWSLARFCQVFHTGLLAAFQMSENLKMAGTASQSAVLAHAGKDAAESIEGGQTLTASMKRTRAFPVVFMQSVATAEESGTLDREMERWAVAEAELASQAQDRLAEWVPRIFYVLVALYVAARILATFAAVYAPLFKMMD
jgi:type II secretory pathway component PulF